MLTHFPGSEAAYPSEGRIPSNTPDSARQSSRRFASRTNGQRSRCSIVMPSGSYQARNADSRDFPSCLRGRYFCLFFFRFFSYFFSGRVGPKQAGKQASKQASKEVSKQERKQGRKEASKRASKQRSKQA